MMQKKMRILLALGMSLCLMLGLAGCGTTTSSEPVAATVNGTEILESEVSDYIASYRASYGYESDEDWSTFMTSAGYTTETLREDIINYLAQKLLVRQTAEELGVTVDSATVDSQIETIRSTYGYEDDETWTTTLEEAGYTEEQYRSEIEYSLLTENLLTAEVPTAEPTDEEIQTYADTYAAAQYTGKKSSHILFDSEDSATAETVLADLQASDNLTEDFAAAATEYSTDTSSAADGGNVGWDCLTTFVTEYTDALDALEVGQMSGLVESDYGYHIILCTESYDPVSGETVDLTTMPTEIYDQIVTDAASAATSTAQSAYIEDLVANADIVINTMPDDLPYAVDTTEADTTDDTTTDDTTDTGTTDTTTDTDTTETDADTGTTE